MWSDASGVDPGFIAAAVSGILPDGFAAIFKGIPNLRGRLHPAEGQVIVVAAVPVSALTTRWPIDATNNNVVYPEADDGALHSNGPANITATFPGTHLPTRRALQTVLLQMIKMEGYYYYYYYYYHFHFHFHFANMRPCPASPAYRLRPAVSVDGSSWATINEL